MDLWIYVCMYVLCNFIYFFYFLNTFGSTNFCEVFAIAGIKKLLNAGLSLCVNGVLYDDVMDSFSNADIMFVLQFRDTNIWGLLPQMQGFPGLLLLPTCAFRAPS